MFDFFKMIGTYEQRKVDNYKNDVFEVDTALVTDRDIPYETAIRHKNFNNNKWIVLGWNYSKEEAQKFHNDIVNSFNNNYITKIEDKFLGQTFYRNNKERN